MQSGSTAAAGLPAYVPKSPGLPRAPAGLATGAFSGHAPGPVQIDLLLGSAVIGAHRRQIASRGHLRSARGVLRRVVGRLPALLGRPMGPVGERPGEEGGKSGVVARCSRSSTVVMVCTDPSVTVSRRSGSSTVPSMAPSTASHPRSRPRARRSLQNLAELAPTHVHQVANHSYGSTSLRGVRVRSAEGLRARLRTRASY